MKISWSTINFKTKNGSRLRPEYYAFTIHVDEVNFLREKFEVSACSRISKVIWSLHYCYLSQKSKIYLVYSPMQGLFLLKLFYRYLMFIVFHGPFPEVSILAFKNGILTYHST